MKRIVLLALALLSAVTVCAQQIRRNYRADGITHISTEAEPLAFGSIPGQVKLEQASFADGSSLYLLYITLEPAKKASAAVPKGVKMALNLSGGGMVRLEQMGEYPASAKNVRLQYAVEPEDMERITRGVKSVDIVTGWNPEDYVNASFTKDNLGALLKRHCEAIRAAAPNTLELQATLAQHQETLSSILSTTNPLVARGESFDYNILLSHLEYKNAPGEDLDLYFAVGTQEQFHIPFDAAVRFQLADGSVIGLLQARDDVNFVLVYPSLEDARRMVEVGISGLSIDCEDGTLEDRFVPREDGAPGFSQALAQELQLIFCVSAM